MVSHVFFYLFWGFASYKPRYLAGSAQVKIHLPASAPLLQRRYFSQQLAGLVEEEEEALGAPGGRRMARGALNIPKR